MAVPVLFYRGPKSSYDASQHGNGIYFCTDTYEIFMNNHSYGGGKVQDVTLNSTNNCLTIHYTSGVDVGADQTIVAGMQALSNSIQTAVSGGITSLTSPDETLTISGSGTSRSLVVNVAKIVSANSAIQVGTDGKLDIFWNEIS